MNREEFTDKFTALFEKYEWDEEKLAGISQAIFNELEQYRLRKNMADVVSDAQKSNNQDLMEQIQRLTSEIQNLNAQLRNSTNKDSE